LVDGGKALDGTSTIVGVAACAAASAGMMVLAVFLCIVYACLLISSALGILYKQWRSNQRGEATFGSWLGTAGLVLMIFTTMIVKFASFGFVGFRAIEGIITFVMNVVLWLAPSAFIQRFLVRLNPGNLVDGHEATNSTAFAATVIVAMFQAAAQAIPGSEELAHFGAGLWANGKEFLSAAGGQMSNVAVYAAAGTSAAMNNPLVVLRALAQSGANLLSAGTLALLLTAKTLKGGLTGLYRIGKNICDALTEDVSERDPNAGLLKRLFNYDRLITDHLVMGGTAGKSVKEKAGEAAYQVALGVGAFAPVWSFGASIFALLGSPAFLWLVASVLIGVPLFAVLLHTKRRFTATRQHNRQQTQYKNGDLELGLNQDPAPYTGFTELDRESIANSSSVETINERAPRVRVPTVRSRNNSTSSNGSSHISDIVEDANNIPNKRKF
jgi:hypothetical protein